MAPIRAEAAVAYLDEAGHVYLPIPAPARRVVKLNASASRLWRQLITDGIDASEWSRPGTRELIAELWSSGAVRLVEPSQLALADLAEVPAVVGVG